MTTITLDDYWMGRDSQFRSEWTGEIQANAARLIPKVNDLIARAEADGVEFQIDPDTGTVTSSGWRPPAVNAGIPTAAPHSKHMSGDAIDIYDPDGDFDEWCDNNLLELQGCGLFREHPSATKGWCHVQQIAPKSGHNPFYP